MPTTFQIGIWSVDTCNQRRGVWLDRTVYEKLGHLREVLMAFQRWRAQRPVQTHPGDEERVKAIFVAPEYFFATPNRDGDRDYYNDSDFGLILRNIPSHMSMLLVPGSIAHRTVATEGLRTEYLGGVDAMGGIAVERYREQISRKRFFIHNTAYAFLNRRSAIRVQKQSNATDGRASGDPEAFVPGWTSNKAYLKVGSGDDRLMFGVEICADASRHGTGYVEVVGTQTVEVKILVSAVLPHADVYHGNYTKMLIHAASEKEHSGVTLPAGRQRAARQQVYLGWDLSFYEVVVP
jgi:Zn-finger nucleic acid-binding protein